MPSDWLLSVALAAAEASWLYAWSLLMGVYAWAEPRPLLAAPVIFALLVAARTATGYALAHWQRQGLARLAVVGLGLVLVTLAVWWEYYPGRGPLDSSWILDFWRESSARLPQLTPAALGAALGLGLWWRGSSQGGQAPSGDDAVRGFQVGVLALAGAALVPQLMGPRALPAVPFGQATLAFCVAVLFSLSLARLDAVTASARSGGTAGRHLRRQWLGLLAVVVGGLVVAVEPVGRAALARAIGGAPRASRHPPRGRADPPRLLHRPAAHAAVAGGGMAVAPRRPAAPDRLCPPTATPSWSSCSARARAADCPPR